MDRHGIAIAGNMLTDYVKHINTYPKQGMLADILGVRRAVGGCVPNTILDLKKIDDTLALTALGRAGADEAGNYVVSTLEKSGIDVSNVVRDGNLPTSFSDAMCARDTGERTFFHCRGANAAFCPSDVPIERLDCKMLHIGYLLLLDSFDERDSEYGTVMARFLHDAQEIGIMTSIDAVSGNDGFRETVLPALKYCDNAIMNEIEACAAVDLPARDFSGKLLSENIRETLLRLKDCGVKNRAIIHCPEAGFCIDETGAFEAVPSLKLPEGYIQGSVGAGDAFAAGCLYAIYNGMNTREMLRFASAAAAANLSAADSVSGMKHHSEIRKMMNEWERRTL